MSKPAFDPSQPFEPAGGKPAFDPSKPFEGASGDYLSDVIKNAGQELKSMVPTPQGVAEMAKNVGALTAIPSGGIPSMDDLRQMRTMAGQLPGMAKAIGEDVANTVKNPAEQFRQKPVSTALNVASVAAPFLAPEARTLEALRTEGAARASDLAQKQAIKSLEGVIGQVRQIGPEKAGELGQFALDKGIVTPMTPTSMGMNRRIQSLLGESGEQIGAARREGDIAGGAPNIPQLLTKAEKTLVPEYEGGMKSGETGQLQNAINEIAKIKDPNFTNISGKATEMNRYASENKMHQMPGATTDVANFLSRESDAALQKSVSPETWKTYEVAKQNFGNLKDIEKFFLRGEAREFAGRGMGPVSDVYHGVKDLFGNKTIAAGADTFAKMLSDPGFAKALPALSNAAKFGPASLETTHYMMRKNDPDYEKATQNFPGGGSSAMVQGGPDTIMAQVVSNPLLAEWGPLFQESMQRGPKAVTATHFTLMQKDPRYNQQFMQSQNEENR